MKKWLAAASLAASLVGASPALGVPAPLRSGDDSPAQSSHLSARASSPKCQDAGRAFDPAYIAVAGVIKRTRVLAQGRDRSWVPLPPPLTDSGKREFAWDKLSHIRPGTPRGVVRLSAHTYPRDGRYGLALGNRLLSKLRVGATLFAAGSNGERFCYKVTRRLQVRANEGLPSYYDSNGRPRLAIVVCSGERLGPGNWTHRTVWFAVPTRHGA